MLKLIWLLKCRETESWETPHTLTRGGWLGIQGIQGKYITTAIYIFNMKLVGPSLNSCWKYGTNTTCSGLARNLKSELGSNIILLKHEACWILIPVTSYIAILGNRLLCGCIQIKRVIFYCSFALDYIHPPCRRKNVEVMYLKLKNYHAFSLQIGTI